MAGKTNFKSIVEVERAIFSTQKALMNGKIKSKDATALLNLYRMWIQIYRDKKIDELIRRVEGLEEIAGVLQEGD